MKIKLPPRIELKNRASSGPIFALPEKWKLKVSARYRTEEKKVQMLN
jgi:hypothetical protein